MKGQTMAGKPRPLSELVANRKTASVREVSLAEVKSNGLMLKKHLADTDIKTSSGMAWISTVNTDKGSNRIADIRNDENCVPAHENTQKKKTGEVIMVELTTKDKPPPIMRSRAESMNKIKKSNVTEKQFQMQVTSISNSLYDENWASKQIVSFTEWMNFTFAKAGSIEEVSTTAVNGHQQQAMTSAESLHAEGQDDNAAGLKVLLQKRVEAVIRQKAFELYHSDAFTSVIQAVEMEVVEGRLVMRDDRDILADLGLQEELFALIFSYEMPWVRLGLEIVFGEIISIHTTHHKSTSTSSSHNTSFPCKSGCTKWRSVIKSFVLDRMFANDDITAQFTKQQLLCASHGKKLKEQLRQHLLKKFLSLTLLLDAARGQALLPLPTLFLANAPVKSSKDVILAFSRNTLRGEGDVLRHLTLLGYTVSFAQSYIDEFDYHVTNLAVDLRDGVRLARLVELLTNSYSLSDQLRVPAVSRLQKLHNVSLVLRKIHRATGPTYSCATVEVVEGPDFNQEAKYIVDGHRDKTLLVLWKVLFGFELRMLIDPRKVLAEAAAIQGNEGWRRSVYGEEEAQGFAVTVPVRGNDGSVTFPRDVLSSTIKDDAHDIEALLQGVQASDTAALKTALLRWCDVIASQYGVPVHDLTSCLADGRALCLLVHYYHPTALPIAAIKNTTSSLVQKLTGDTTIPTTTVATVVASKLDSFVEATSLCGGSLNKADLKRGIEGERRNFAMLRRACHAIGGVPLMLPIYDSENLPEEKTMTIFLGFLFARLIESSNQVRAVIRIQRFVRRIQPVISKLAQHRRMDALSRNVTLDQVIVRNKTSIVPTSSNKRTTASSAASASATVSKFVAALNVPVTVIVSASHAASTIQRWVRLFLQRRRYTRTLQAWKERLREVEADTARQRALEQQQRRVIEEAEREKARVAAEEEEERARAVALAEQARRRADEICEELMAKERKRLADEACEALMAKESLRQAEEQARVRQAEADDLLRMAAGAEVEAEAERLRNEAEASDMMRVVLEAAEIIRVQELAAEKEERERREQEEADLRQRQQVEEIEVLRAETERLRREQEEAEVHRLMVDEQARIAVAQEAERWRLELLESERLMAVATAANAVAQAEAERRRVEIEEAQHLAQAEVARIRSEEEALRVAVTEAERVRQEARFAVVDEERRKQEELAVAGAQAAAEALRRLEEEARQHQEDLALAEEERRRENEVTLARHQEQQERLVADVRKQTEEEARARFELELRAGLEKKLLEEEKARARAEEEVRLAKSLHLELEQKRLEEERTRREHEESLAREMEAKAALEHEARVALELRLETEAQARLAAEAKLRSIEEASAAALAESQRHAAEELALAVAQTHAAMRLQACWRGYAAKRLRVRTIYGLIVLQSRVRGGISRSVYRQRQHQAAVVVKQGRAVKTVWKWWRTRCAINAFRAVVEQAVSTHRAETARNNVLAATAAIVLQAVVRGHRSRMMVSLRRQALEDFEMQRLETEELSRIAAAQEAERMRLEGMESERIAQEVENIRTRAVSTIARWFRALRPLLRCRKLSRGFRRLQAMVRARRVRAHNNAKVNAALKRIQLAEQRALADPSLRLGKQTQMALHTLQSCSGKMISAFLKACQTLELSTQLSHRCSRAFAEAGASKVLFTLIRSCNRSTPHQELLKHALVVLLHVARHHDLAAAVASPEAADTLIDLMQMFRDKKSIFGKASELLCRLIAASKEIRATCTSVEYKKRLDGILHIVERKHRLEAKVATIQTNSSTRASLSFSMSFAAGGGAAGIHSLLDETFDDIVPVPAGSNNHKKVGSNKVGGGGGSKKGKRVLAEEEPIDCIQQIMKMLVVA